MVSAHISYLSLFPCVLEASARANGILSGMSIIKWKNWSKLDNERSNLFLAITMGIDTNEFVSFYLIYTVCGHI